MLGCSYHFMKTVSIKRVVLREVKVSYE
jgi:hypothetical protein